MQPSSSSSPYQQPYPQPPPQHLQPHPHAHPHPYTQQENQEQDQPYLSPPLTTAPVVTSPFLSTPSIPTTAATTTTTMHHHQSTTSSPTVQITKTGRKVRSESDRKKHAGWRKCPRCSRNVSTNGRNYYHHMNKCDPVFFAPLLAQVDYRNSRPTRGSASVSNRKSLKKVQQTHNHHQPQQQHQQEYYYPYNPTNSNYNYNYNHQQQQQQQQLYHDPGQYQHTAQYASPVNSSSGRPLSLPFSLPTPYAQHANNAHVDRTHSPSIENAHAQGTAPHISNALSSVQLPPLHQPLPLSPTYGNEAPRRTKSEVIQHQQRGQEESRNEGEREGSAFKSAQLAPLQTMPPSASTPTPHSNNNEHSTSGSEQQRSAATATPPASAHHVKQEAEAEVEAAAESKPSQQNAISAVAEAVKVKLSGWQQVLFTQQLCFLRIYNHTVDSACKRVEAETGMPINLINQSNLLLDVFNQTKPNPSQQQQPHSSSRSTYQQHHVKPSSASMKPRPSSMSTLPNHTKRSAMAIATMINN